MRECIAVAVLVSMSGCDIVFRLDDLRTIADASDEDDLDAPARQLEDYVIARYELDETTGDVAADSGPAPALNLTINNPASIAWRGGALDILQEVRLSSGTTATKIIDACKASDEISIEVWATPTNTAQTGPARLVSISSTALIRDVTVAQDGVNWILRVRNTATNGNGTPNLVAGGTVSTNLTHLVATHTTGGRALYVDGVRRARDGLGGSLDSWIGQPLLVANEGVDDGTRFWRGSIYRIVVYSRAMAASEVTARFNAGL